MFQRMSLLGDCRTSDNSVQPDKACELIVMITRNAHGDKGVKLNDRVLVAFQSQPLVKTVCWIGVGL